MADDAGALLVRSGLVPASALEVARARVDAEGGTLGEQLVAGGAIGDEALTDFYKSRLLVPQVNPNTLARLAAKVVAIIPSDMAIELRAIPVSLDGETNLTVAMSDPSDRHAVDEIAFFTGAYIVRAVATQMQIAWCLAHYYGHVTPLGQRLLQSSGSQAPRRAMQAAVRARPRGMTGRIEATRRRAVAPGSETDVARPASDATTRASSPAAPAAPDAPAPRARSISGEIRVAGRRAASIRPPLPDESGPVITMEVSSEASEPVIAIEAERPAVASTEEPTDRSRPAPRRKRPAEPDPPELAARAGEVRQDTGKIPKIEIEEARIIIADDAIPVRARSSLILQAVSGEVVVPTAAISGEVTDAPSAPVVIHEHLLDDRRRPSDAPTEIPIPVTPDDEVVVLEARKQRALRHRKDRHTQMGIGAVTAATRLKVEEDAVPSSIDDAPTGSRARPLVDPDPTRVDAYAAPAGDDTPSDEHLAAPPRPMADDDTSPIAWPPGATPAPPPSGQVRFTGVRPAVSYDDDDEDVDEETTRADPLRGKATAVMTAIELDEIVPQRALDAVPAHLARADVDDGWGPPGTTIPPTLLGAIPGSGGPASGIIPIPNIDSAPLMVAPPAPPERSRATESLARTLEQATSRVLELIAALNAAHERDEVIALMSAHLAESHRRAGFFATRGGELSLFAVIPRQSTTSTATLRLDRPSTLQDVVGTRLPYRGPMHDDASRTFLAAALGACPPEILLVPITVRERVVGVLFGEHRLRHTFDDQLALAGRAAGMTLERILKSRRG